VQRQKFPKSPSPIDFSKTLNFKNVYQLVGLFSSSHAILDVKNIVGDPNTKY
jgi:hypothetical protein